MALFLLAGCVSPAREAPHPLTRRTGNDNSAMVFVPAGTFLRGAKKGTLAKGMEDVAPGRMIVLDAFYIDKFEVTHLAYARFLAATGRAAPKWEPGDIRWGGDWSRFSWRSHRPEPGTSDLPVTLVTWFEAEAYCAWAGKRLPTEAEWEKAARGESGRLYPWGEVASASRANLGKRFSGPLPVGSFPEGRSVYGAMDMAGNAAEWVADYYGERYYESSPEQNPKGPPSGNARVIRGGYWGQPLASGRGDHRWQGPPGGRHGGVGFRCTRSKEAG
ncbi:MAG: SUMF1/EgtB/PvdO family nonheme iron enzyme [bacterium]|nr:SUMF1/EgtB/PvdO family nonheme iron enzyme [bacterium]